MSEKPWDLPDAEWREQAKVGGKDYASGYIFGWEAGQRKLLECIRDRVVVVLDSEGKFANTDTGWWLEMLKEFGLE